MSPSQRQHILYIEDIITSMSRIMEYTLEMDFKDFRANQLVIDAVVRNFEIIGEASKSFS